jgi:hypothetical protein
MAWERLERGGVRSARREAYGIAAYCNAEPACRDQLVRLRRSSGQVLFGTQTLNDENILSSFESQSAAAPGRERWRMDASAQHT